MKAKKLVKALVLGISLLGLTGCSNKCYAAEELGTSPDLVKKLKRVLGETKLHQRVMAVFAENERLRKENMELRLREEEKSFNSDISITHNLFFVDNVIDESKFYETVFGFSVTVSKENDFASLRINQSSELSFINKEFIKKEFSKEQQTLVVSEKQAKQCALVMKCSKDKVDPYYEQALKSGGKSVLPPLVRPYGSYLAYVEDPAGLLIEIASKEKYDYNK